MRWIAVLLALSCGCAAVQKLGCAMEKSSSAEERCSEEVDADSAVSSAERARAEKRALEHNDEKIAEREHYRAARQPCAEGDARACYTVALYDDHHGASDAQVEPRYRQACIAGVAHACFFAGEHEPAGELKLASYDHGCALGDPEACLAGWHMDHGRRDLLEAACHDHFRDSCQLLAD